MTAPESGDYTGKLFAATLDTSALPETLPDGLATPTLKYTTNGGKEIPAIEPGTYAAVLEWGGKSAADQFEIYAKTMTASAEKVEQTYDGNAYGISVSVTGPETYTVKYGTTEGTYNLDACPTKSEVGDGPLTVFYKITADHYSPVTGSATVTINPKLVTVTAKDQTIKSDESIQTGPDYVTLKGELDGHTVAAVTLTDKDSALIPFAAVIYDADGKNVTANYDINYVNGVLTILGDIGHSAADVEKEYDGNAYGITVSVTGPETYTIKYGTAEGTYNLDVSPAISDVADSPLTVYYQVTADGYSPAVGSATVTINPKPVTVTAKGQTLKENESIRTGADYATLAGALEGHTLDAFGLSTEGTAIIPSAAAIYDADGNNVTANYDITYVNGSLSAWATYARSVTFKVVNGSWNDGTMADKTVLLSGYTGDTLTLEAGDIPAVGMMPGLMFKAGAWDVTPGVGTAITTDLVFTYTYAYNPDWRPVTDNNPGFPLMLPWYLNPDFRVETTAPAKPEEPAAPEPAEPAPVRSALPFTDVDPLSELYEIVSFVYERGLMKGTTNTEFDPFGTMTRGMLVSLLYRIEGSPEAEYSGAFKDVSSSSPYASAVEWAYRNGLVLGYGEKYGPDDPITREQLAVIVQRYVNWKGIKTAKATLNVKDAEKVSEAMRDAVAWAVVNHILALDNGNVRPTDTLLRWEVAYAIRTLIMSAAK